MRYIALFLATFLVLPTISAAQEHRPDYSAKDIGARQIEQREAQAQKPAGPPLSLFAAPLAALEKDFAHAEKQHDVEAMDDALAANFLAIAGNGQVYTKAELLPVLKDFQINDYILENFRSVDVRDDVVVLTYSEKVLGTFRGERLPLENVMSSVWHKPKKGRWQMVFHTSTAVPPAPITTTELEGLEQDLVAREGDRDVESLQPIIADDAVIVAPDGKRYTKAQMIEDTRDFPKLPRRISEVRAYPLGEDSGVVICRLEVKTDEKILPYTSNTVWKRGPAGWQVVSHQYTQIEP